MCQVFRPTDHCGNGGNFPAARWGEVTKAISYQNSTSMGGEKNPTCMILTSLQSQWPKVSSQQGEKAIKSTQKRWACFKNMTCRKLPKLWRVHARDDVTHTMCPELDAFRPRLDAFRPWDWKHFVQIYILVDGWGL